jgi:hypothetical protein
MVHDQDKGYKLPPADWVDNYDVDKDRNTRYYEGILEPGVLVWAWVNSEFVQYRLKKFDSSCPHAYMHLFPGNPQALTITTVECVAELWEMNPAKEDAHYGDVITGWMIPQRIVKVEQQPKVFCSNCVYHLKAGFSTQACGHPSCATIYDDPITRVYVGGNCWELNKNNNCSFWTGTRLNLHDEIKARLAPVRNRYGIDFNITEDKGKWWNSWRSWSFWPRGFR